MSGDVSVVIPVYNRADLLPRSIESVLAQTVPAREIIVVDDGSQDGSADVASRYGGRVQVIRQQNQGVAAARNAGICAASGEWVAFLDADDALLPHAVEKNLACVHAHPNAGVVYGDAVVVDPHGSAQTLFLDGKPPAEGWVFDRLLNSGFVNCSAVMVRRKALLDVGLFRAGMRHAEDYELWLRLARHCEFALVPEPIAVYYRQPSGLSLNHLGMARGEVSICEELLRQPLTAEQRHNLRCRMARNLFDIAWELRSNDPAGAVRASLRSVRMNPGRAASWKLLAANTAAWARRFLPASGTLAAKPAK
ncbi:MAG: glycosyltransferase [Acidobacteriaceae bacterium]